MIRVSMFPHWGEFLRLPYKLLPKVRIASIAVRRTPSRRRVLRTVVRQPGGLADRVVSHFGMVKVLQITWRTFRFLGDMT